MSKGITESVVEECSLDWLRELGYEVLSGLAIAPGETTAERSDYKQVFLFDPKLEDLNPKIPLEGLQEALRKVRLFSHPTLIENNRAFHRLLVEGVDVEFRNHDGQIVHDKVWLAGIQHRIGFASDRPDRVPCVYECWLLRRGLWAFTNDEQSRVRRRNGYPRFPVQPCDEEGSDRPSAVRDD